MKTRRGFYGQEIYGRLYVPASELGLMSLRHLFIVFPNVTGH